MLASIKVSVRDTLIYGLGNIAVKIVGLILIPLYTSPDYFTVDDFGILGLLEISGLVLTALLASSLPQSLTRWYWDKDHVPNQKGIFFMTFTTQVAVSLVFVLLLLPLSKSFSVIIFGNTDWWKVLNYVVAASALQAVNNIINTLMRLQSRPWLYISSNIFKLLLVLFLTVYLIVSGKKGLEGIYLAQVIGNICFILILALYTIRNSAIYFSRKVFAEMNAYGYPLLLANISAVALNVIDRYALNSMAVLKYVAVYTLAFKVSSALKLVIVDSIKLSVSPMMIKKISAPDNKRFYSKVLLYTSYVVMLGIVFLSLFSQEIVRLLARTGDLWSAAAIIPVLALSVFFINLKEITVYGLHIVRKTRIIGAIVLATSFISIALNILLIPLWDVTGCAVATLLSQMIYWLIVLHFSQKHYFIPYETRKITLLLVTGTLLSFTPLVLDGIALVPGILIKMTLFISFPFILYLFRFYEKTELEAIRGFLRKWSDIGNLRGNLRSLRDIREDIIPPEN